MAGLIYGVGINDADYVVQPTVGGGRNCCPFYRKWSSMIKRCYCLACHKRQPAYIGCQVTPAWQYFTVFREWMGTQDWFGKDLDKDVIGDGKTYSPDNCVFISKALNRFMTDRAAKRGKYPIGVAANLNRFNAQINIQGTRTTLGTFDTPEEAHQAWAQAKAKQAFQYATEQTDQRIADALRSFGEGLLWAEY